MKRSRQQTLIPEIGNSIYCRLVPPLHAFRCCSVPFKSSPACGVRILQYGSCSRRPPPDEAASADPNFLETTVSIECSVKACSRSFCIGSHVYLSLPSVPWHAFQNAEKHIQLQRFEVVCTTSSDSNCEPVPFMKRSFYLHIQKPPLPLTASQSVRVYMGETSVAGYDNPNRVHSC